MATGTYGTIRPADVSPEDVQIIMNYTPSRDVTDNFVLTQLDATSILRPYFNNAATGGNTNEILGGLYNLRLPAETFTQLGIYTMYIRPAEIRTSITDCGVLSALPNVKGIVIDLSNVPNQFVNKFIAQGLVGYRVEYLNADGSKIPNFFRIITSNFYCEPVIQNLTNTQQKVVYKGLPIDDPKQRRPDITKARNILSWEPKVNRAEGLKITYDYFKSLPEQEIKHKDFTYYNNK